MAPASHSTFSYKALGDPSGQCFLASFGDQRTDGRLSARLDGLDRGLTAVQVGVAEIRGRLGLPGPVGQEGRKTGTVFLRAAERAPKSLLVGAVHPYLLFRHVVCELPALRAEDWLDSDNLVARLNLPNMDPGKVDRVDVYAASVRGLFELEPDAAKQAKARPDGRDLDFIDIYARLTDNETRRYRRRYPEEANIVTGFLQRARDEGMRQGMRQGRAEGVRAVLERQLVRRFGPLPSTRAEQLRGAPETDVEAWADNVLDAGTLDEVFGTAR